MISCQNLAKIFKTQEFIFFTGVPCSILKDWLSFIGDDKDFRHIIATSEGEACAIASGYYLATGKIPIVYMQNSGFGNSVDPLTSLLNKEAYGLSALLLISWRGEPGKKDEPQHIKMGKTLLKLLKTLNIPYIILPGQEAEIKKELKKIKEYFKENNSPYAIVIRKGIIKNYQAKKKKDIHSLTREEVIKIIVSKLKGDEAIIATTGKTSRELFELREAKKQSHETDFYTIGSMGCSAGIALVVALQKSKKKIFVLDGDGAVLMKMGILATIGHYLPENFYHIILDNNTYDSTGGQKTVSDTLDFSKIALACGYRSAKVVSEREELTHFLRDMESKRGPSILVVKIKGGARKDLGRLTKTPAENKKAFMKFLLKNQI